MGYTDSTMHSRGIGVHLKMVEVQYTDLDQKASSPHSVLTSLAVCRT